MKKILAVLLVLFLVGCSSTGTTKQTIATDDGKVTIEGTSSGSGEWCEAGADWKWTGESPEGLATGTLKIDRLISSGKYAGLCHVIYTAETPQGEMEVDYYFNEEGTRGYFEMDINGEKFSQEWSQ